MNQKIKVLVSGVGGDVAQGVIKALNKTKLDVEIIKICAYHNSSWLYKDDFSYIAPLAASKEYVQYLINIMNKLNIDVFFPCIDSEMYKIACNRELIQNSTNTLVCIDSICNINICNDKYETYRFLKLNGFPCPETILPSTIDEIHDFIDMLGFPIIVKKRMGQGGKDIQIVNSYADARSFIGKEDYILQEFLCSEDDEYTSGIYVGDDGEVKGICTLRRELKNGTTYRAERIIDSNLEASIKEIAVKMGMTYLNIQSRDKGGVLYPFEFNGRFSGTTGIISRVFNAPEMYIREKILKEKIPIITSEEKFYVMRYYEELYVTPEQMNQLKERSKNLC
ncbi:MAG: ATP-grasp domain-containing protein [bacterium]|nr:ATP-grasp domain-containing protein [bacterium]